MNMPDAMIEAYRTGGLCRPFLWRRKALRWVEEGRPDTPYPWLGWYEFPTTYPRGPTPVSPVPSLTECVGPWEVVTEEQVLKEGDSGHRHP